jgi:sulfotransferase family protein
VTSAQSGQTQPLFLLSLPRSGSTLVQRMLAAHPQVASAAEPWLLLPYLYTLRSDGVEAEYGHGTAVKAISDFARFHLEGGRDRYLEEGRRFFLRLYGAAADGHPFFLDKTPRYHLVARELLDLFPDAKVLFLWRNPLAVAASIIESWNRGNWNLDTHMIDLKHGLARLVSAYERTSRRAVTLRYEDLVVRPEHEIARVVDELGLPPHDGLAQAFAHVRFPGSMGDRWSTPYDHVSREPLAKWPLTLANPVRRAWAHRYLGWIGRERLAIQGYDYDRLREQLDGPPLRLRGAAGDLGRIVYRRYRRRARQPNVAPP